MSSHTFNYALVGYKINKNARGNATHVQLRVARFTSNVAADAKKKRIVPPLRPSSEELNLTHVNDQHLALWVGVTFPQAKHYRFETATPIPDGADIEPKPKIPTGNSVYSLKRMNDLPILRQVSEVSRVVVRTDTIIGGLRFYELANNDEHGLCIAYPINAEDVFFFKEFRIDSVADTASRRSLWAKVIIVYIAQNIYKNPTAGSNQIRDENTPSSYIIDLTSPAEEHQATNVRSDLDMINEQLENIEASLEKSSGSSFTHLHQLINIKFELDRLDFDSTVVELQAQYPALSKSRNLTQERLKAFALAIRDLKTVIKWNEFGPLLWAFLFYCAQCGDRVKPCEALSQAREIATEACGSFTPTKESLVDDLGIFAAHTSVIKSIIALHRQKQQELINLSGPSNITDNLDDVYKKIVTSRSVESARTLSMQATKLQLRELLVSQDAVGQQLEKYLRLLEKTLAENKLRNSLQ